MRHQRHTMAAHGEESTRGKFAPHVAYNPSFVPTNWGSKVVIDATRPSDFAFGLRLQVPKEAIERMERIFWAECCKCHGKFYRSYREMRHSGVKLMCPFCRAEFLPEEAASIDDRWIDETAERAPSPGSG